MKINFIQFKHLQNVIKSNIFYIIDEILNSQFNSSLVFIIFILLETTQIIFYSFNINSSKIWDNSFYNFIYNIIQYTQLEGIINLINYSHYLIIFYVNFFLQNIILIIFFIIIFRTKKLNNKIKKIFIKILSWYAALINTFFVIPSSHIYLITIFCNNNYNFSKNITCYSGFLFWINFILSCYGLIFWIILSMIFSIFIIEWNPFSNSPIASNVNNINVIRLFLKIILPLYLSIDYKRVYGQYFLIFLVVFYIILIIYKFFLPPYYNKNISIYKSVLENSNLWIIISIIIQKYSSNTVNNLGFIYSIFGIIIFNFLILLIKQNYFDNIFLNKLDINNEKKIEKYLIYIILVSKKPNNYNKVIEINKILHYHLNNCYKNDCICRKIIEQNIDNIKKLTENYYHFIITVIQFFIERFPDNYKIKLLYTYVMFYKINNNYQSLLIWEKIKNFKISFIAKFSIYRLKNKIEININLNNNKIIQEKGINIEEIINFQDTIKLFENYLKTHIKDFSDFWKEIDNINPKDKNLNIFSKNIINREKLIQKNFQYLYKKNPKILKTLILYSGYVLYVKNNMNEYKSWIELINYTNINDKLIEIKDINSKNIQDIQFLKSGFIFISGNNDNLESIIDVNENLEKMIGYSNKKLVGKNINTIMPDVYNNMHTYFIKKLYQSNRSTILNHQRIVFVKSSNNYITPILLYIKLTPSLTNGIEFLGILSEIKNKNSSYILIDFDEEEIIEISTNLFYKLGITNDFLRNYNKNGYYLKLKDLCPELLDLLKNNKTIIDKELIFNTVYLRNKFIIDEEYIINKYYRQLKIKEKYKNNLNLKKNISLWASIISIELYRHFNKKLILIKWDSNQNNLRKSIKKIKKVNIGKKINITSMDKFGVNNPIKRKKTGKSIIDNSLEINKLKLEIKEFERSSIKYQNNGKIIFLRYLIYYKLLTLLLVFIISILAFLFFKINLDNFIDNITYINEKNIDFNILTFEYNKYYLISNNIIQIDGNNNNRYNLLNNFNQNIIKENIIKYTNDTKSDINLSLYNYYRFLEINFLKDNADLYKLSINFIENNKNLIINDDIHNIIDKFINEISNNINNILKNQNLHININNNNNKIYEFFYNIDKKFFIKKFDEIFINKYFYILSTILYSLFGFLILIFIISLIVINNIKNEKNNIFKIFCFLNSKEINNYLDKIEFFKKNYWNNYNEKIFEEDVHINYNSIKINILETDNNKDYDISIQKETNLINNNKSINIKIIFYTLIKFWNILILLSIILIIFSVFRSKIKDQVNYYNNLSISRPLYFTINSNIIKILFSQNVETFFNNNKEIFYDFKSNIFYYNNEINNLIFRNFYNKLNLYNQNICLNFIKNNNAYNINCSEELILNNGLETLITSIIEFYRDIKNIPSNNLLYEINKNLFWNSIFINLLKDLENEFLISIKLFISIYLYSLIILVIIGIFIIIFNYYFIWNKHSTNLIKNNILIKSMFKYITAENIKNNKNLFKKLIEYGIIKKIEK